MEPLSGERMYDHNLPQWEIFLLIKFLTSLFAKENTTILACSITAK